MEPKITFHCQRGAWPRFMFVTAANHRALSSDPFLNDGDLGSPELQIYGDTLDLIRSQIQGGQIEEGILGLAQMLQDPQTPESIRTRAGEQWQVIQGESGFTAERQEFLLQQFVPQVMDPVGLGSMLGAGLTFKLSRWGLLHSANRLGLQGSWLRPVAGMGAFGLEATSFPLWGNLLSHGVGTAVHWENFSHQVASSFLVLGGLRLFGHGGQRLQRMLPGNSQAPWRPMLQQGAMYGGIVSGHGAEQALGLAPVQGVAQLLGESAVTWLQFNGAARILHSGMPGSMRHFEGELEHSWRRHGRLSEMLGGLRHGSKALRLAAGLGLGLASFLEPGRLLAQERASESLQPNSGDPTLPWVFGIATLGVVSTMAVRFFMQYRFRRMAREARENPQILQKLARTLGHRPDTLQVLTELGRQNPDAIRVMDEAARRAIREAPADPRTEDLFHRLKYFDVTELQELAATNPRVIEALRVLASEPYQNHEAFRAIQQIPIPRLEAMVPQAQAEVEVAYTFWQICERLSLPNAWGVMLSLDWPKFLRNNIHDWRAVQMSIAQLHHERGITLSDLQDLSVQQIWAQTPAAERAQALIRTVEPLASHGNAQAAGLIRSLDPKKFSREIPAERDLFQVLGILEEYGVARAADVLAPFAEGDPVALAYLVRMAHYGDKIAFNLMHTLRVQEFEALAKEDFNALCSLFVLNRQGHQGAQRALERLFGENPFLEMEAEEGMGPQSPDTRVESPKYNLHQVCEFYLDRFSSLSEAEKVHMVNHIWETWQALSPQEKGAYFEQDRNGAFSSKIPISFIEATFLARMAE